MCEDGGLIGYGMAPAVDVVPVVERSHGLVLLSLGRQAGTDAERRKMYRLSAWFLVPAVGNFLGGYWYTTIARSAPPRT